MCRVLHHPPSPHTTEIHIPGGLSANPPTSVCLHRQKKERPGRSNTQATQRIKCLYVPLIQLDEGLGFATLCFSFGPQCLVIFGENKLELGRGSLFEKDGGGGCHFLLLVIARLPVLDWWCGGGGVCRECGGRIECCQLPSGRIRLGQLSRWGI